MSAPPAQYYKAAGAYFDAEVESLDELDRTNPIHQYIRRESLRVLEKYLEPPGPVLELGYGPGLEAVHLAKRGVRVVGLDPSPAMQARARERAKEAGLRALTDFRLGSTADIAGLVDEFGAGSFKGAYATLGPFNLTPNLREVAADLDRLLAPGAAVASTVLNKYCLWETVLYIAARDFRRALRRQVGGWGDLVLAESGARVRPYPLTPGAFAKTFGRGFEVVELFALPALVPPPYAARTFSRFGGLLPLLERADIRLRGGRIARALGDHFEVVLRRRAA